MRLFSSLCTHFASSAARIPIGHRGEPAVAADSTLQRRHLCGRAAATANSEQVHLANAQCGADARGSFFKWPFVACLSIIA